MAVIFYLSANHPVNNTGTSGGAIDAKMRLLSRDDSDDIAGGAGDYLDLVSASALDTQNVSIIGKAVNGTWVTEVVALNGTSHVQSANEYLHIRKIAAASDANGIITVARYNTGAPVTLFTVPVTERGGAHLALYLDAEAGGGAPVVAYEKLFMKAVGASYSGGKFYNSEDEDNELTWDLEMSADVTVVDGSETTTNRLTEPTTGGTYSWGEHADLGAAHDIGDAEDGNLAAGEGQGIWVRITLAAGRGPEAQVIYTVNWSATGVA